MGRPRIPTEVKIANGNPGKRPLNKREPKPIAAVPTCPDYLKGYARQAWKFYSRELYRLNVMTNIDALALEGLCVALDRALRADRIVEKEGFTYKTHQGNIIQRPEVSISKNSWVEVRKFLSEFGMTPAARSRIQVEIETFAGDEDEDDAKFFTPSG